MENLKNLSKGLLITFEGGEGSGKSTLMQHIYRELLAEGFSLVCTREPGGSKLGETIRHLLLDHDHSLAIGYQAELLLFLAARAQHIEELIQPALEAKKIVLCDRFNDSTIAYQGVARGLNFEAVKSLCQLVCGKIKPDLTLFLDVDPEIGMQRRKDLYKEQWTSEAFDRIELEKLDFHKQVQYAFQNLTTQEPERMVSINASQPQEAVWKEALAKIRKLIGCN